jgi:hypothetical protein
LYSRQFANESWNISAEGSLMIRKTDPTFSVLVRDRKTSDDFVFDHTVDRDSQLTHLDS